MAVPDSAYRAGDIAGQFRMAADIAGTAGVLSAAQAATSSAGTEAHGARRGGITPGRDKPSATGQCPGCGHCLPSEPSGYVIKR